MTLLSPFAADLRQRLVAYLPTAIEQDFKVQMLALIDAHPRNCWLSSLPHAHFTASAWIIHRPSQQALLTHHAKLDRWLQLGGHCEPADTNIAAAALREAQEESGLSDLVLHSEAIFDLDIHPIPARGDLPAHLHYDVRFLLEAHTPDTLRLSTESKALRWIPWADISQLTHNESISRMTQKGEALFCK